MMKISKKTTTKAIIIAICTAFSVQIMPMSKASQMLTPAQRFAARKAALLKPTKSLGLFLPLELIGHKGQVVDAHFTKDDKRVVTLAKGDGNNIIIWDTATGKPLKMFDINNPAKEKFDFIRINHEGNRIITGTKDWADQSSENNNNPEIFILWDSEQGKQIETFEYSSETTICQIKFSSNGKRIIFSICHEDESTDIIIVDSNNGSIIAKHRVEKDKYFKVNPHGDTFFVVFEKHLNLYDSTTGKMIAKLDGPTDEILYPSEYNTSGTGIIAHDDKAIFVWNGKTGKREVKLHVRAHQIALSPDKTKIAVAEYSAYDPNTDTFTQPIVSVYDATSYAKIMTFENGENCRDLTFSPDNTTLAITGDTTNILNIITGEKLGFFVYEFLPKDIWIKFNSTGTKLKVDYYFIDAMGVERYMITFWNISNYQKINFFVLSEHEKYNVNSDFTAIVIPDTNINHKFILQPIGYKSSRSDTQLLTKKVARPVAPLTPRPLINENKINQDQQKEQKLLEEIKTNTARLQQEIEELNGYNTPESNTKPTGWVDWIKSWWK